MLIRVAIDPQNVNLWDGEASTIIQLIDGAIGLGQEAALAALKLLAWRLRLHYQSDPDGFREEICPYLAMGILILLVWLHEYDLRTAQCLIRASQVQTVVSSDLFRDCIKKETWERLIRQILLKPESNSPEFTAAINQFAESTPSK